MKPDPARQTMLGLMLAGVLCVPALSQSILIDDFNDGNAEGWTPIDTSIGQQHGPATFDASSLSYHLEGGGLVQEDTPHSGTIGSLWNNSLDPIYSDGYLRAKVRAETQGSIASLGMRFSGSLETGFNGYLFHGSTGVNAFIVNRIENSKNAKTWILDPVLYPFYPGEDWLMEVGAVGDELTLKAWTEEGEVPDEPQLTIYDSTFDKGMFGVEANIHAEPFAGPAVVSAIFDDIVFTFPENRMPGDFEKNQDLDIHDVALLVDRIHGDQNPFFDVNRDGSVDSLDLWYWVTDLKRSSIGDANLDGEFNSSDLVTVFAAGRYETGDTATWSEGDWNADRRFGSDDLIVALGAGGFESGRQVGTAAVPEPAGLLGVPAMALWLLQARRRLRNPCSRADSCDQAICCFIMKSSAS